MRLCEDVVLLEADQPPDDGDGSGAGDGAGDGFGWASGAGFGRLPETRSCR
jgi:hypothetical protein